MNPSNPPPPPPAPEPQARPSQWQRSTTRRLLLWFSRWKNLRKIVFPVVALITLLALLIAFENWRGQRAWETYAAQLKERGEPVHYRDIIPEPVPDDQNFAAIPFFEEILKRGADGYDYAQDRWPDDFGQALSKEDKIRAKENRPTRPRGVMFQLTDLMALEMAYRNVKLGETNQNLTLPPVDDQEARAKAAAGILKMMQEFDPVLEEMRQAMDRPHSRYNIQYDVANPAGVLLPHLAPIKGVCQTLKFKAVAELAAGHPGQALEDVRLMMRVADSLQTEPILISYLVRVACLHLTLSVVWEGLATQAWSTTQLESLQQALTNYDLLHDTILAFRGERAFGNGIFEFLRSGKDQSIKNDMLEIVDDTSHLAGAVFSLFPTGWLYLEQLNCNRLFDRFLMPSQVTGPQRIDPSAQNERAAQLDEELSFSGPIQSILSHKTLAKLLLPAISQVPMKGAQLQARIDMAVLACALERFRQQHGRLPESLAELTPDFLSALPNDVVSDAPYQYRPRPEGGFLLYSIGMNEKDDGGTPNPSSDEGDWVWTPYPQ